MIYDPGRQKPSRRRWCCNLFKTGPGVVFDDFGAKIVRLVAFVMKKFFVIMQSPKK